MSYYESGTERVLRFLKDQFGAGVFKSYFEGDPIQIGMSSLPSLVVEKIGGTVTAGPTGMDRLTEQILIKVIFNKKDDFGASDNVDLTEKKLRQMVEGRVDTTGYYEDKSLMGCLRANYTLGQAVVGQDINIGYDVNPFRPDQIITSEAHVTISMEELIVVPTRT
jgi:hypothetical protein